MLAKVATGIPINFSVTSYSSRFTWRNHHIFSQCLSSKHKPNDIKSVWPFFQCKCRNIMMPLWAMWPNYDDVIKWKHFPRYWPFVRGIHRSPVNSQHNGQWRGSLMFSLICPRINDWVNNCDGDLRRHRAHCDVIVMSMTKCLLLTTKMELREQ